MNNAPPLAPLDRLFAASDLWVAASRTSRSALAKQVVNDTGFFSRLDKGAASPRVDTMQKFARFFADEASWPDGRVPAEARVEVAAFCHVNGVSVSWGDPATGSESGASPSPTAPLLEAGASHPPTAPLLEAGSRTDIGEAA